MKKKIILSSVLSIVLCLSLIAGATFALFTSEARVNIAVTSGNVKLTATLTALKTESLGKPMMDGAFELGGQAGIVDNTLKISKMTPGDKATVTIDVDNDSDVAIQYCIKLVGSGELFPALEAVATTDGAEYVVTGAESATAWVEVTPGAEIKDIELSVLMPHTVGNEYQGKSADIAIQLVAVQGNADSIELEKAFAEGGVITSAGVPNSLDNITDEDGNVIAGVTVGLNDVTLQDIVLNKSVAGEGYALGLAGNSGKLTLDEGAVINAGSYYGVLSMSGEIAMNKGSKITANGTGAACILVQSAADIYLYDSGLLDPQNGAIGIWVTTGVADAVNIHVPDMAALGEYSSMLVKEYDTDYPIVNWYIGDSTTPVEDIATPKNDAAIDEAIKDGDTTIALGSGTFIIPDSAQGKTLTIVGNGKDTVIANQDDGSYEGCDYSLDGATVVFEGVTITTDSSTYSGYARLKATYNNCTFNGTYTTYDDAVFNNCTFNVSGDVYNLWTWGATNLEFNGCTFNSDGKALLLYGGANTNLVVDGCTFNDKGGLADKKAAIEIGTDWTTDSKTLTVTNTVVNGYEYNDKGIYTGSKLWGNKNSIAEERLTVSVDGVEVYGPNAKDIVYIDSAEAMVEFARRVNVLNNSFKGMTVQLTADIDLAGIDWEPIGQTGKTEFKGVFDGNGHTIKNLSVDSTDELDGHYSSGLFGWIESHGSEGVTVKNLTIDGAKIAGHHNCAVVVGYIYGTVENVTVKNATVSCVNANDDANGDKAGIIAGYVGDATVKGCKAIDCAVSAGRDAGQIVGAARTAQIVDCSATNVSVVANGTGTGKNVNEAVIGRVLG